jgi:hypothetical protein
MIVEKEIGSDYEINLATVFQKRIYQVPSHAILLSTGRDCLQAIIDSLDPDIDHAVLLPSYLCSSILVQFRESNVKVAFYKIDQRLGVDLQDFEDKLTDGEFTLALVINYFGFIQPHATEIKNICDAHKVLLIEDQVQSCLSKNIEYGDFIFNSYRKIAPVADGAFLKGMRKSGVDARRSLSHGGFVFSRIIAAIIKSVVIAANKRNFTLPSLRRLYWRLFMLAEKRLSFVYKKPAKISVISKLLLQHIDFDDVFRRRRENYIFLAERIQKLPGVSLIHENLPIEVCPIGMPVLCKGRDQIEKIFNASKIFPPVHWRLPKEITREEFPISHEISDSILTIPIDQRCSREDMERIADLLTAAEMLLRPAYHPNVVAVSNSRIE